MIRHPDFLPRIPDQSSLDAFASMSLRGMMVCAQTKIDALLEAANPEYLADFMGGMMVASDVLLAGKAANGFYLRKGCIARSAVMAGNNLRLYVASTLPHEDGITQPHETISWVTYSADFVTDAESNTPGRNRYIAQSLLPSLVHGTILHAKTKPKEFFL